MDFRILGPLEVVDEGRARPRRERAASAVGRAVAARQRNDDVDRLIDDLWGERPPAGCQSGAGADLPLAQGARERGGRRLGQRGRDSERGYELRLDQAHRFERLVAAGRSELTGGDPERAASALEEALSLWRGEPLAELAYEPFAQREIARLDDLRLAALERFMDAKLALGGHAEVVEQLEVLIGEHPYRERFRAQLMLALYRCDRQVDALQAYQDARERKPSAIGIEPGEHLRELERAILAQDPELAWETGDGQAATKPAPQSARSAFVGRERELARVGYGPRRHVRVPWACVPAGWRAWHRQEPPRRGAVAHATARGGNPRGPLLGGRRRPRILAVGAVASRARARGGTALCARARRRAPRSRADPARARERFPDLPEAASQDPEAARFRLFTATVSCGMHPSGSRSCSSWTIFTRPTRPPFCCSGSSPANSARPASCSSAPIRMSIQCLANL